MVGLATQALGDVPLARVPGPGPQLTVTPGVSPQAALVLFAVHTLVAEENAMDAEKAFVTLTVLTILRKAQVFLPLSINSVVQVRQRGGEALWGEPCRGVAGRPDAMPPHTAYTGGGRTGGRKRQGDRAGKQGGAEDTASCQATHSLFTASIFMWILFPCCLYSHCAVMAMRASGLADASLSKRPP